MTAKAEATWYPGWECWYFYSKKLVKIASIIVGLILLAHSAILSQMLFFLV